MNFTFFSLKGGQNYIGCFGQTFIVPFGPNTLPDRRHSHDAMTRDMCFANCLAGQMKYAGLYGRDCSCGRSSDNYANFGEFQDVECWWRCPGNHEQFCGGGHWVVLPLTWAAYISIFEVEGKSNAEEL